MSEAVVVFSTCASLEEARRIARATVEERFAACAQVVPQIQSIYYWQGAVEESAEALVLFKTTAERLPKLEKRIAELHSYDTPEILAVPVGGGAERYLAWLRDSVSPAE
jgi:periplasmic divalent cation tolerance protein